MEKSHSAHLLSIGEFSAATQLTPKALRLYDDQRLLRPAATDAANGYRYYQFEQVAVGRLIRSLRDMNLSLTQIAQVLDSDHAHRQLLLREFLREAEQRLARERFAYQAALLMMHSRASALSAEVIEIEQPALSVSVWEFASSRRAFYEQCLEYQASALRDLNARGIQTASNASCVLLEPLTDDDTRLELHIPIDGSGHNQLDLTIKHLPARRYACMEASLSSVREGFTAPIDTIFDWFDRRGVHVLGHPEILLDPNASASIGVRWTFASNTPQEIRP